MGGRFLYGGRMIEETIQTVMIERMCVHCLHEWSQRVDREQLRKLTDGEAIGNCPNASCGMPT